MKKELTESELIKAMEKRSGAAAALFYDRYAGPLFKIILIQVVDRSVAEDVLTDTILFIWNNISSYHSQDARFLLWMAGISKRKALNKVKKQEPEVSTPVFKTSRNGIALN